MNIYQISHELFVGFATNITAASLRRTKYFVIVEWIVYNRISCNDASAALHQTNPRPETTIIIGGDDDDIQNEENQMKNTNEIIYLCLNSRENQSKLEICVGPFWWEMNFLTGPNDFAWATE